MVKIITDYGFCFGVQKAIDSLLSEKNRKGRIFLTHPLLHNLPENNHIMSKVDAHLYDESISLNKEDLIVLSAHGHEIEEEEKFSSQCEVLDCTCPLILSRYKSIHPYDENISFLYLGKKNHQETKGFLSHFPYFQFLDSSKDALEELSHMMLKDKVVFVPQTTISYSLWNMIKDALKNKEIVQILPVCSLYLKRSNQAITYLKNVDKKESVFIVCGDKASSNAKEIYTSIKEAYPDMEGFIALKKEDFPYQKYDKKDFYIASATSVSKKTVEELQEELEVL